MYEGAVTLSYASPAITLSGADITFNSTVDNPGSSNDLVIDSTGAVNFYDNVGAIYPFADVTAIDHPGGLTIAFGKSIATVSGAVSMRLPSCTSIPPRPRRSSSTAAS